MKTWKTVAVIAVAVTAVALAAVVAPPVRGQTRVTPKLRAFEMLSGGSRIGVSIRDVEESDASSRWRPLASRNSRRSCCCRSSTNSSRSIGPRSSSG